MKIVTAKEMTIIETKAYEAGCSEEAFMEEAGHGVAEVVRAFLLEQEINQPVLLLAGKGNNGGDAYVAGCYLLEWGFKVFAWQVTPLTAASPLCQKNANRFIELGGAIEEITKTLPKLPQAGLILDGLFGTGFHGKPREPFASVMNLVNQANSPLFSIDIPSGVNGNTGEIEGAALVAQKTIALGLPKSGFFLGDGWNYVGKMSVVDFGLPQEIIEEFEAEFELIEPQMFSLPPLVRNRHKYQVGYVVGMGGSKSMPGAALLTSTAALRAGAGVVRLLHPEGMETLLQTSPYELIKTSYSETALGDAISEIKRAKACFFGPGIGQSAETQKVLKRFFSETEVPCVVDADALNLIAVHDLKTPSNSILTPHRGEMQRLLKSEEKGPLTREFLHTCKNYSEEKGVILVLKGAPTFIFHPGSPIRINPFGDPGMATAGSGDVLTGIIAALLAQGLSLEESASFGVYLHALAGEMAAGEFTSYSLIASDLIELLPEVFHMLMRELQNSNAIDF